MLTPSPNLSRRKSVKTEVTIFKLIQEHPSISRVELAREARLSTAAITAIVRHCDEVSKPIYPTLPVFIATYSRLELRQRLHTPTIGKWVKRAL